MRSVLPQGLSVRAATVADAAAIARLIGAVDQAFGLPPWANEADILDEFGDPDLDLVTDTWVLEGGDSIVGYAELWNARREDAEALEGQGWVAPEWWGRGVGTFLVETLEAAARSAGQALRRRPVVLRTYFTAEDDAVRRLLEDRGYGLVRHFFHMAIELDQPVWPDVPDGLLVRPLDPGSDPRGLYELMEHAFSEHWGWMPTSFENFWRRVSERDDFDPRVSLLAFEGDRLVGAAVNVVKSGEGWVNDLGVRKDQRGRGIGELLLRCSFAIFAERGLKTGRLGVDAGNETGAVRLYERVGMRVVRRFDTYSKVVLAT